MDKEALVKETIELLKRNGWQVAGYWQSMITINTSNLKKLAIFLNSYGIEGRIERTSYLDQRELNEDYCTFTLLDQEEEEEEESP